MQLLLLRSYGAQGVNGVLYLNDQQVCYTIELPWQNNQRIISCIPEGSYPVVKRYSQRFGWHLHVQQVPGRTWILIHPANHAIKELQGCIAPVSLLTGEGRGNASKRAMQQLMKLVNKAINQQETILLTISNIKTAYTNKNDERSNRKGQNEPPSFLPQAP